jgi:hypothetical protein
VRCLALQILHERRRRTGEGDTGVLEQRLDEGGQRDVRLIKEPPGGLGLGEGVGGVGAGLAPHISHGGDRLDNLISFTPHFSGVICVWNGDRTASAVFVAVGKPLKRFV